MVVRQPLLSPRALAEQESRGSVAITVSWMLTMLATAGAVVLALLFYFFARSQQLEPQSARLFSILSVSMLIVGGITGLLCLGLTLAVYRVRRDPPPISITVAAVFVSSLPLATMLLLAMRG
jgi:hypothetical protein